MQAMKAKDSAGKMSITEVDEVIADLEKEKSDREFEDEFNAKREVIATKLESEGKENVKSIRVHFKRPPKTSEEAIETLQQAD